MANFLKSDSMVASKSNNNNLCYILSKHAKLKKSNSLGLSTDFTSTIAKDDNNNDSNAKPKLEVLCDGFYYDVTDFIHRHPGGNIIELYTEHKEDATIAVQQFHYRSLKTVLARMKGLSKRPASPEEIGLDPETKKRHDALTADFLALFAELETEGLMKPDPLYFLSRMGQSLIIFLTGLAMRYWLGSSSILCYVASIIIMTLGSGKTLFLGHSGGHNAFTGYPVLDRIFHTLTFGFVYGLSAASWRSTHSEHHAMPQHETKDADLKTMPLLAFNKRVVEVPENKGKSTFLLHYQHILFVLCDTFLVTMTWKLNHHIKFCWKNGYWFDLFCMATHYTLIFTLGFVDWLVLNWLSSVYVLGNLILSHTHLPVVENGKKLHWVEYSFLYTTNIRSSWWVDWWTGHLNYQIEHHLFPCMPEYKGKLCRDKVKALAKRHGLPYQLCSYWEAVKYTYFNLERVAKEIGHM